MNVYLQVGTGDCGVYKLSNKTKHFYVYYFYVYVYVVNSHFNCKNNYNKKYRVLRLSSLKYLRVNLLGD